MKRIALLAAGLVLVASASANSFTFDFEDGWQGWTPYAVDWGEEGHGSIAPWEVTRSGTRSTDGQWSVRMWSQNFTDAVKIWIERPFTVTPGVPYTVKVDYKLATMAPEVGFWNLIGYAADNPARHRDHLDLWLGDTFNGFNDFQYHWLDKSFTKTATAADGQLWLGFGVWGTFENIGDYYFDSVRVTLTPVPEPGTMAALSAGIGLLALRRRRG